MNSLLHNFTAFLERGNYRHDIVAGLIMLLIQVVLLSILAPILLRLLRAVQTRRLRVMIDFYLFQIFHKITRMFLEMLSINDILPIVLEEQERDPAFLIESHPAYGNLENILFVLNKIFGDENRFRDLLETRTLPDFRRFLTTCEKSLDELDRLISILSGLPKAQMEVYKIRIVAYVLRDQVQYVVEDIGEPRKGSKGCLYRSYELRMCMKEVTTAIGVVFQKRKKLTDSVFKHRYFLRLGWFTITTLFIVVRRWFLIRVRRLQKMPYEEQQGLSFRTVLLDWRKKHNFSLERAAEILGMSRNDYRDYEFGYRVPGPGQWTNEVARHVRGEIDYSNFR